MNLTDVLDADNSSQLCESNLCVSNEIIVDRDINGKLFETRKCIPCVGDTKPSADRRRCEPCSPFTVNCTCPSLTHEIISKQFCIPRNALSQWPDEEGAYHIHYDFIPSIDSQYLRAHLRSALFKCTKLKERSACQAVGNMCVLSMYKDSHRGGPCRLFRDARHIPTSENEVIPWIYYAEGDAGTVLHRKKITSRYRLQEESPLNTLNFTVAKYTSEGELSSLQPLESSDLQLCPGSLETLNSAFRVGAWYHHSCSIPISQLLKSFPTLEFFDIYLQFYEEGVSKLYAVPVLLKNLKQGNKYPNQGADILQWQLTRRFFLVDSLSGIENRVDTLAAVRFLKSVVLQVKMLHEVEEEGRIYPPLLILEYAELKGEEVESNLNVNLSFSVEFIMENDLPHIIDVSLGVSSAFAVVWSAIQTWSYSRRNGRVTIDAVTLTELLLISCGHLANMFFVIMTCASLFVLVYYKGQSVTHILLPTSAQEYFIYKYVMAAFLLKTIEIVRLVWRQVTIDIFLIDWEKPRATGNATSQPISIWRTYFIANEFNEIQTKRKTNPYIQLLLTVFILNIIGVEHWALAHPKLFLSVPNTQKNTPYSDTLRFALGVSIFIAVYLLQYFFIVCIYERYIKNEIQQFIDVCSIANISVFILAFENYGYYIHGRSVHGFADTDMYTIISQLCREEEDLVAHRGLIPASDQQTFQMYIPPQLRAYYSQVKAPLMMGLQLKHLPITVSAAFKIKMLNSSFDVNRSVQAYHNMNKFLAAFLEHALKDLDYEVKDKQFMESLLDIEFLDTSDKGIFYYDNGHSFDDVMFYGNEFTLFTFDIILFSCCQIFSQNYLLSAIYTAFVAKLITVFRSIWGRKNLAKKTLIDERFLI
ncbi:unnamed protein product [Bemisia tabaci]|uniref:Meckelin n=2 Tax=Bemisia tabaci TaxID=7038 RepID=A0A9P0EXS4_BEMTA|nr:PREDICTED: meckelin [Bemisia tabaci]CAH0381316.1 unnamed protein product [Bemisia tabaci]